MKDRSIQDKPHMVCQIIEKADGEAAVINMDQSKAFDKVDHRFLEAVLAFASIGPHFQSWVRLLYKYPEVLVEVNVIRSFAKSRCLVPPIRPGSPPMLMMCLCLYRTPRKYMKSVSKFEGMRGWRRPRSIAMFVGLRLGEWARFSRPGPFG